MPDIDFLTEAFRRGAYPCIGGHSDGKIIRGDWGPYVQIGYNFDHPGIYKVEIYRLQVFYDEHRNLHYAYVVDGMDMEEAMKQLFEKKEQTDGKG